MNVITHSSTKFPCNYFTLLGVVTSDVSRFCHAMLFYLLSRHAVLSSVTPCCSIFCHAMLFYLLSRHAVLSSVTLTFSFKDVLVHFLINVISVRHPGAPPSSFPRHHSVNACINKITPIVSACMSKESHLSFDKLGNEFASCLKFIQYMLMFAFFSIQLIHSILR